MDYFSDKQIAKKFGVHRTTVWRWVRSCGFPKPIQLSPGCTRWQVAKVQAWEHGRPAINKNENLNDVQ